MPQTQIRISLNQDFKQILDYLQKLYTPLNRTELFKLAISELYQKKQKEELRLNLLKKQAMQNFVSSGDELGNKFLKQRSLSTAKLTDQELFNLVENE